MITRPPAKKMAPLPMPLATSKFTLNSAGVAGFFGGKEAISAMATVHLYRGRRWLGWFNSPGSYVIAKRFGRMANSRFWDGLFPGPNDSPAVTFGLDGKKGPEYIGVLSGTTMMTGHLGYLTLERSRRTKAVPINGRKTKPIGVSYLAMKPVDYKAPVKRLPLRDALLGLIPISISILTCVMCALVFDWFSFSMILLGIISSGLASCVIGSGRLGIKSVHNPASGSPSGHGVLVGENEVVVIKGKEQDVNAITKGSFVLETDSKQDPKKANVENENGTESDEDTPHRYDWIGICSLLLIIQFLLQLLLIPQGSLFGQIMFLVSLFVSWGYNSYLSSLEKEKIQTDLLFRRLGDPVMHRFRAGTRTTMAVFVCLLLFHGMEPSSADKDRILREKAIRTCIPNDTPAWARWTEKVVQQALDICTANESLSYLRVDEDDRKTLSDDEVELLIKLLADADAACKEYLRIRGNLPVDSSAEGAAQSHPNQNAGKEPEHRQARFLEIFMGSEGRRRSWFWRRANSSIATAV